MTDMRISIEVGREDFDVGAEIARLRSGNPQVGAVASFIGTVRDLGDGDAVQSMVLEHYPGMTERSILDICEQAYRRWPLQGVRVIHRIGELHPQDQIVLVAVAGAHRGEAFKACEFIMDYLKTQAPFWKKERGVHGERWVQARGSDDAAASRWQQGRREHAAMAPLHSRRGNVDMPGAAQDQ